MRMGFAAALSMFRVCACALAPALLLSAAGGRVAAAPLLPDLFAWEHESRCYMHCGNMNTQLIPNKVLYQFVGALPNSGAGPLEVREVTHPNNVQDVYQRIYQTAGPVNEVLIGSFPNAASIPPRHLFLPGIAQYNLRTVLPGDGVGPIVSSNDKTSMAVVDSSSYNTSLPGAPSSRVYDSVSDPILGISIGWADVYTTSLPGQWVEATGLADGAYWLEVIADPYNRIQELNETNNTTRIKVNLVVPEPQILPGDYNDDDSVDAADYVVWRKTLGQIVPQGRRADGNADGTIGPADYTVWRANFGITRAGDGSATSNVPEPATLTLVMTVCGLLLSRSAARSPRATVCR
ncbi:MAG TPA: lysyl oxidase family protein [Lacipirellulaceae bacterium]|nr:lysyl oxidase family protein [Lacipirellulaceae bacterium]